eukprot:2264941-Amphidinium_carterae.2
MVDQFCNIQFFLVWRSAALQKYSLCLWLLVLNFNLGFKLEDLPVEKPQNRPCGLKLESYPDCGSERANLGVPESRDTLYKKINPNK